MTSTFRSARGFTAEDGRSVSISSTRLCILVQPRWFIDHEPGTYVFEDRYHTEIVTVRTGVRQ